MKNHDFKSPSMHMAAQRMEQVRKRNEYRSLFVAEEEDFDFLYECLVAEDKTYRELLEAATNRIMYSPGPAFIAVSIGEGKRGDKYTCSLCGKVLKREWDDDIPAQVFKQKYGEEPDDSCSIVCGECYVTRTGRKGDT